MSETEKHPPVRMDHAAEEVRRVVDDAAIGFKLYGERVTAGASRRSVARAAGISDFFLYEVEVGKRTPDQDTVDDIRAAIALPRGESGRSWLDWRYELRKAADEMSPSYSETVLQALADEFFSDGLTGATETRAELERCLGEAGGPVFKLEGLTLYDKFRGEGKGEGKGEIEAIVRTCLLIGSAYA
jgi:hypothetical protein